MTKRKALVLLLLLACVAIAGLVVTATKNRDPSYNGRPLSEWLDQRRSDIPQDERTHALQQIGTNALPLLLQWIQFQPSRLELKLYGWLGSSDINPINRKFRRRQDAIAGFATLGDQAKPAIPTLALLLDSKNINTMTGALDSLGAIGKAALPTLIDVVTNSLAYTNCYKPAMAYLFRSLQTNAFLAKPAMLAHICDRNEQVASAAINVLGILGAIQEEKGLSPDTTADIIPALSANLDTTNHMVLLHTIRALSRFGSNARPAVPALLQKLTSTNQQIRAAAATALNQIVPEALQRAQKP